ncbi:MAG: TonB-dependent receptor [Geobacteraceae bacterium]|jgi:outer membrane receptor protein involved in Fe transport
MFHLYWEPAWVPAVMSFLCLLITRFTRSRRTGIRFGQLVCLSAGVGCLLGSVIAFAQDLTGQNTGADQTQAGIATLPTVTVKEKALDNARAQISPSLGATTYTLDSDKIDSQSQGEFASFDQTFYRFPGVVQDELDKRLHVRGEEANLQYRINGLLLPDGLSGFGQELSSKFLDSVSLITGTLPAQYGNRTAGIVDIRTKSGQELHGGTISVYGGDYHTAMPTIEYAGSSGSFSGYGTVSYRHDALGMANPTSSFRPKHDDTDQFKGFGNFSYLIDDTSRLTLILSAAHSTFQLPTTAGQPPHFQYGLITAFDSSKVNENQYEQAYYEILGYQKSFGDIDLQVTQSTRYSDVSFKPDTVADVIFNGIASDADHMLISNNLQCDASYRVNDHHTVRSGLSFIVQQAVVNTTDTVLPATWNGTQWAPTPNGQPFGIVDNNHKTAELYGAYLQDEWRLTPKLTVNYGLRADLWAAYITEAQISPRINFVYKPFQSTTLHAGYGRYFTPPPLELIQVSDVSKFDNTTNGVDPSLKASSAVAVQSERYHYFDVGVNQDITPNLHVGVDAYYKIKKNVLDEGQFGPAMIFSPNNATKGLVRGVEFTVSYEKDGLAAWGNFARSQATAKGLTSGQWQFSAADVAYMQSHWFHLDHDQDWTASAGGSYQWRNTKVYADALYGSGLYGGLTDDSELPSYVTVNLGMTHDFKLSPGYNLKVRFDVTNVGDIKYEIREGNGIGVFAPQFLPRRAIYAGVSTNF